GADHAHYRELVLPLERLRGVYYGPRAEALLVRRDDRVERAAPGAANDVNVARRLAAGGQRPQHLVGVVDVHVLVYHDHVAPQVRARATLRRHVRRLLRVARVALADADDDEEPPGRRMDAHALHVGHARRLHLVPDGRRAQQPAEALGLRRGLERRRAHQDRVVAVVERLHADHWLGPAGAGVVAGPLAERSLDARLAGHRLSAHAARPGVLALPLRHVNRRGQEQQRVVAERDRHWARLAGVEVLLPVHAPVLAGRDEESKVLLVVQHHAVGAGVHPAGLAVARDVQVRGADVPAAVLRVVARHGQARQVDGLALETVLEDRRLARRHLDWLQRIQLAEA